MDWLTDPEIWASLITLTALEIVLGVDNLVFIAIVSNRLPLRQRDAARKAGLALALITRLALLASIGWLMGLTEPAFEILKHSFSWRDVILVLGGLFLLYKGTLEIHEQVEGDEEEHGVHGGAAGPSSAGIFGVAMQIMVLDIVFSLDSVITAVGMANEFWVMATAIVIAVIIMLVASAPLAGFINAHPTVRMLALGFLLLVGTMLVAEGFGFHVPKGYIYAAIGFSIMVESLNLWAAARRRRQRERIASSMEKTGAPGRS
jgi:predicted tellurium resistance membrane protein TerC